MVPKLSEEVFLFASSLHVYSYAHGQISLCSKNAGPTPFVGLWIALSFVGPAPVEGKIRSNFNTTCCDL